MPRKSRKKPLENVFGSDSDQDDERVFSGVSGGGLSRFMKLQANARRIVEEDAEEASVCGYDEVYEAMQREKNEKVLRDTRMKETSKPKYIAKMQEAALERKRLQDIVVNRKLAKEHRKNEIAHGNGGEKFVTQGYKEKLLQDKKWEKDQMAKLETIESSSAAHTGSNLGFMQNLLNQRVGDSDDIQPDSPKRLKSTHHHPNVSETGTDCESVTSMNASNAMTKSIDMISQLSHSSAIAEPIMIKSAQSIDKDSYNVHCEINESITQKETETKESANDSPTQTTEEKVAAARERYLARIESKRKREMNV